MVYAHRRTCCAQPIFLFSIYLKLRMGNLYHRFQCACVLKRYNINFATAYLMCVRYLYVQSFMCSRKLIVVCVCSKCGVNSLLNRARDALPIYKRKRCAAQAKVLHQCQRERWGVECTP